MQITMEQKGRHEGPVWVEERRGKRVGRGVESEITSLPKENKEKWDLETPISIRGRKCNLYLGRRKNFLFSW